jgi:hypothetical protein
MSHNDQPSFVVDGREILVRIIKYVIEGTMVAIAVSLIPQKKLAVEEILTIGLIAAATFSLLDVFAPSIGASARQGAGFGIGASIAQWPAPRM